MEKFQRSKCGLFMSLVSLNILTSTGNLYLARDRPFSKVLSHILRLTIGLLLRQVQKKLKKDLPVGIHVLNVYYINYCLS